MSVFQALGSLTMPHFGSKETGVGSKETANRTMLDKADFKLMKELIKKVYSGQWNGTERIEDLYFSTLRHRDICRCLHPTHTRQWNEMQICTSSTHEARERNADLHFSHARGSGAEYCRGTAYSLHCLQTVGSFSSEYSLQCHEAPAELRHCRSVLRTERIAVCLARLPASCRD